jgi:hypothetical protein
MSRISDHFPVFFTIDHLYRNLPVHNLVTLRDFSENNVRRFTNSLLLENWANVFNCNDPNDSLNNFMLTFKNRHSQFFSPRVRRFNKNINKKEKWMTTGLLISRLKKLELAKNCSYMPSPVNTTRYKSYRNLFNRLVRLSRKMYYEEQLSANISNLRKTWQILNEALNIPKNKQSISKIMVSNTLIDNPLEIANQFNTFFYINFK